MHIIFVFVVNLMLKACLTYGQRVWGSKVVTHATMLAQCYKDAANKVSYTVDSRFLYLENTNFYADHIL